MAITYTWEINKLHVLQTPKTDFVSEIEWICKATDSDTYKITVDDKEVDVPYTAQRGGTIRELKESESFTAFADLTELQVVGWVKNILGENRVAVTETATTSMINSQKNPPVTSKNKELPW